MDVMGGVATGAKPISGVVQPSRPPTTANTSNPFGTSTGAAKADAFTARASFNNQSAAGVSDVTRVAVSHTGERVSMVAEAVGLVALAALSVYFYTQNSALTAKVNALSAAGSGATAAASDLTALTAQVQTLTASNAGLTTQVSNLTSVVGDLKTQLSFFATPQLIGTSTPATLTGTVSGVISTSTGAKGLFSVRAPNDIVIFVKNSSDPKVVAILKPLVGSTAVLTGPYVIGSDAITVTNVNGNLVNPLVVVATSTTATTKVTTTATAATTTTATVTTVTTTTVTTSGQ
jgi:hypothetical protein